MTPIVLIIPVLGRPWRVKPLIESIEAATPGPHRTLFVGSPGDDAEHEAARAAGGDLLVIDQPRMRGDWARKINAGYQATTEPLMLLGGDDLHFHAGWQDAVCQALERGAGVIGTNDLGNPLVKQGVHSTHPVVTRAYADQFGTADQVGKVAHEGYDHCWVDNEIVETAKRRGKWAFAVDAVVEHRHWNWGKTMPGDSTAPDEIYQLGQAHYKDDRALYLCRMGLWR